MTKNECHNFLYATREKLTTGKNRRANIESKMHISPSSFRTSFFSRACLFDELRDRREKPYSSYKEKSAATTADHWNGKPSKHCDCYNVG